MVGVDGGSPAGATSWCDLGVLGALCGERLLDGESRRRTAGLSKALTAEDAEHAETCGWASMVESGLGPRYRSDLGVLGVLCGERLLDGESRRRTAGLSKALTAEDAEHAETCGWASMVESGLGADVPV